MEAKILYNLHVLYQIGVWVNQRTHFPLTPTYFLLLPATLRPNYDVSVLPAGGDGGKSGE